MLLAAHLVDNETEKNVGTLRCYDLFSSLDANLQLTISHIHTKHNVPLCRTHMMLVEFGQRAQRNNFLIERLEILGEWS